MTRLRSGMLLFTALALIAGGAAPASARSVGQVIDDAALTTEIKAKLTADKLSNLMRIEVSTNNGIVTLNGVVEDPERRARAAQIASGVGGVKGLINNIHVAGTTIPPAPTATASPPPVTATPAPSTGSMPSPVGGVDATGTIASIDERARTITLQDGRVLRLTESTMLWQPSTIGALRPGSHVYVRGAVPLAVQPTAAPAVPEWRMGTVRTVDRGASQLILSDGTMVRVGSTAVLRRGSERLALEQITPGSEVVVRTIARGGGTAEGSALPGQNVTAVVDAAEINVVWTPVTSVR
ncbi:MAG: BON domain-containing protein [Candidatus Rokubacteria bacterium]|nr:BON domain-containing protein [Candidatus Rokubacteria bacterium]